LEVDGGLVGDITGALEGQSRQAPETAAVSGGKSELTSYVYDTWGAVMVNTANFANGWHHPYLYDGKDGACYGGETGLYWLAA
jgi:hypothetical protein